MKNIWAECPECSNKLEVVKTNYVWVWDAEEERYFVEMGSIKCGLCGAYIDDLFNDTLDNYRAEYIF